MKRTLSRIRTYTRWISRASLQIRKQLVLGTVFGVMKVACGLAFVVQSKEMIDTATGSQEGNLWQGAAILASIVALELVLGILNGYLYTQAENLMKNGLRARLFGHLLTAPLFRRDSYHSGDLTARLEEDVRIVTSNITTSLPTLVITGTQFLGAFWLLTRFDRHLAWIIVGILPMFILLGKVLGSRLRKMTRDIRNDESRIQSQLQEGLQHSSLLRSLEAETSAHDSFSRLQHTVYLKILKRTRFTLTSRTMLSLGFTGGYIVAFLWGCFSMADGRISFGVMTAFLQLVAKIQGPTASLASLIPGFIHASTSVDRLMELEGCETEERVPRTFLEGRLGIRFEHIRYTYPDGQQPLYDSFSFDFPPGSRTLILGPTGAGKTTLIRLILALLRPDEGRTVIYNAAGSRTVSSGTRCNISYVPQGNTLLSGTIRENLLLANPQAGEEEIARALHTAVAEFVYDLPDGLDTLCREQGNGLSEGQAQRIAIARGLLKPASILLLDEISASLDKDTEMRLFDRLVRQAADKTLILISHREEAGRYCDRVLHLQPFNP